MHLHNLSECVVVGQIAPWLSPQQLARLGMGSKWLRACLRGHALNFLSSNERGAFLTSSRRPLSRPRVFSMRDVENYFASGTWTLAGLIANVQSSTESSRLVELCGEHLRHLQLTGPASDECIRNLAGLRNLTSLDLNGSYELGDESLKLLASSCPHMKYLNLTSCIEISDGAIEELASSCSLEVIVLGFCEGLGDNSLRALATSEMLQSIDLSGCCGMSAAALAQLLIRCPIRQLNLAGWSQMSDAELVALAPSLSRLWSLNLHECSVSDDALVAVAKVCTELIDIVCPGIPRVKRAAETRQTISDRGIAAIAASCTRLRRLSLFRCQAATDDGVVLFHNLLEANLAQCVQISDRAIISLAASSTSLELLNIWRCEFISDAGLESLAASCCALIDINFSECTKITDRSLKALARSCKSLRSCNACRCDAITDEGICCLAEGCTQLEQLNVSECFRITDLALEALARNCPSLTEVNLRGCTVSDAGLMMLGWNVPALDLSKLWGAMRNHVN